MKVDVLPPPNMKSAGKDVSFPATDPMISPLTSTQIIRFAVILACPWAIMINVVFSMVYVASVGSTGLLDPWLFGSTTLLLALGSLASYSHYFDYYVHVHRNESLVPTQVKFTTEFRNMAMDFHFLPTVAFFKTMARLLPNQTLNWFLGNLKLQCRKRLAEHRLLTVPAIGRPSLIAEMMLNSCLAISLEHIENNVAVFKIRRVLIREEIVDITVQVDLTARRWASTTLISQSRATRSLDVQDTLVLIFYAWALHLHPMSHAAANFAVEPASPDPYLRQLAACTLIYNHGGWVLFEYFVEVSRKLGFLSSDRAATFKQTIGHSLQDGGTPGHPNVRLLATHSRFVAFVLEARHAFRAAFARHRHSFPHCQEEALFAGTVLHSLDHSLMAEIVADPLWIEAESEELRPLAELGRFIAAGFNSDLPGITLPRRFHESPHPFFKEVYEACRPLDPQLAGYMDCCIVK